MFNAQWKGRRFPLSPHSGAQQKAGARVLKTSFQEFARDTAGDVAIIFGLMALVLFGLIGAAVDLGRWLNARDQTVSAIDSAVLAAARALQTNGGNKNDAIAVAEAYYKEAVKSRLVVATDDVRFDVVDNGSSVQSFGNATIATPFMGVLGVRELPLLKQSGIENSKAVMAVGGNAKLNLEIALMLDVSGSMRSNHKIDDLRDAASDLVDIIVWDDQSEFKSRVALVPFSTAVRPPDKTGDGSSFLAAITDPSAPASQEVGGGKNKTYYYPTTCVGERSNGSLKDDDLPGKGGWIQETYMPYGDCGMHDAAKVMPLSNSKAALKLAISRLVANGNTAGHIGVQWTHYMLSPKWESLFATESKPSAYGAEKTEKYAVLMTDGEFNWGYDNDGLPQSMGGGNSNSSSGQAISACNKMKQDGIIVYTIGFDLGNNSNAKNVMKNCASDDSKAYTADTGDELKLAFRDIALKVAPLYLANSGR